MKRVRLHKRRLGVLSVATLVASFALVFVGLGPAPAQTGDPCPPDEPPGGPPSQPGPPCDPYGQTTTTDRPGGPAVTCELRPPVGHPGQTRITVTVSNVPTGSEVRILWDGEEVARREGVAAASVGGALFGGPLLTPAQTTETVELSFIVPADAEPGVHFVDAVGPTFSVRCKAANGRDFEVLSTGQEQGGGDDETPRSLAFTGIFAALLVAAALVLLLVGRAALAESRRRRRRHARRTAERERESAGL